LGFCLIKKLKSEVKKIMYNFTILKKGEKADPLYGLETYYFTEKDLKALIEGKRLYANINSEYAIVIKFKGNKEKLKNILESELESEIKK
jgi:hypothetical protein